MKHFEAYEQAVGTWKNVEHLYLARIEYPIFDPIGIYFWQFQMEYPT